VISCQAFRANLRPGSDDAATLVHLRTCDACLEHAVSVDPDFLFRSIGGEEIVPPGGVDAFVADVMAQVRVRSAETSAMPRLSLNPYLRAAAAVLFVIAGTTGIYRYSQQQEVNQPIPDVAILKSPMPAGMPALHTTKAIVETYQSENATIVELPSASPSDVKVVMIYDESLPADL
jgi:hypothetical protein